jgi:alginate O-acetyltransferase complex protein AlgI
MVFSSIIFLFVFLPVVLFVYFFTTPVYRNIILLLSSLFFYAWGEPVYVLLLLCSIAMNYLFGKWLDIDNVQQAPRYRIFVAVSINLLILGIFKYGGFFLGIIYEMSGISSSAPNIPLPLGISFFTFHSMSYLIDVYRKAVPAQRNLYIFSLYMSLFPQLVAGPIIRYKEISTQLNTHPVCSSDLSIGIERFIRGLLKKLLIANQVGIIADTAFATPTGSLTWLTAWLGIIAYTLQIYFDFSGYSDMAIGLGRMFGFHFPENFNFPYTSRSITEFWRRWHISLSTWFRDYLYIPLGGNRGTKFQAYRNILIVWTLTGFWHGASWTFVAWGFYYGTLLLLEIIFLGKFIQRLPRLCGHLYALLIVMVGWVFFRADDFGYSFQYLSVLLGVGAKEAINSHSVLIIRDNWFVIAIGLVCSFPFVPWLRKNIELKLPIIIVPYARLLMYSVAFVLNIMYLVNSSYNPFIYFRF